MEYIRYERPREKLRNRGAAALSLIELLQLIIGSGNAKTPGAKLAREVEQLLVQEDLTYTALIAVEGLGVAKVCQILAALELSRRL